MRPSLRSASGMTLIEVMVTVLVVCVGTLATLGTYVHFSSATRTARDRSVLNSVAQREIERLRPLDYAQLGLATPTTPQAGEEAPLAGAAAAETPVTGGIVRAGGDEFTYDNVRMRLYRYVTYRQPTCNGLTPKIQAQLAGRLGLALSALQAAIANACSLGISTTKRITVVAVPVDDDGATERGVSFSTVKRDPESLPILDVPTSALSVEPVTDALQGGGTTDAAQPQTQTVTMTDTRCSDTLRDAPSDHETRDTAQFGYTCSPSGAAPKLMTIAGIPGSPTDPVADFSTDVTRAALGGLAILRDSGAGTCAAIENLVYSNADAEVRSHSMVKWATLDAAAPVVIPAGGGRASLTLFTSTADATPGPARLCVTLQAASTGAVLGSVDFRLGSWPGKTTELTTAFDVPGMTLPSGERLLLTLRVPSDSGEDLRILYDHPSYQSSLSFTTEAGSGFVE